MSEPDGDLELQGLQHELDDAFQTTRPRPAFEDELWLKMQTSRPPARRLGDALAAFFQGIREVPAVPLAAVAAVLVVVIGVGIIAYSGRGHLGGGGASSTAGESAARADQLYAGAFGRLPTPAFNGGAKNATAPQAGAGGAVPEYSGPVQLTWTGKLDLTITSAPVYRYNEPSTSSADQFASALGAVLRERPSGFLGSYSASDYTLKVRGTVQSPPTSPAYFILANLSMPDVQVAGATAEDLANIFLAEHSLLPQWPYKVSVDASADPIKVHYERQFTVPGYGPAHLVDSSGVRYGMDVYISGKRPTLVSGPLPVNLETSYYRIVSPGQAFGASPSASASASGPTIQLDKAELVYILVPARDHSFYEPAFLLSGSFQLNGTTMVKHVLVPAIDPSQRAR